MDWYLIGWFEIVEELDTLPAGNKAKGIVSLRTRERERERERVAADFDSWEISQAGFDTRKEISMLQRKT